MPTTLRDRAQPSDPGEVDETDSEIELTFGGRGRNEVEEGEEEEDMDGELVGVEEEEELDDDALASPAASQTPLPNLEPPPSYLREISTLASWTVSSSKPGCSIPQLRHPSTSLFWQSDGPQPHYLNIHFFKLVRIVGLRLYLDFEQDESYTPTRIIFLAGSGMNDLQEWGEMKLESPRGWIWADFSAVGDADSDDEDDEDDESGMLDRPRLQHGTTHHAAATPTIHDGSSDSENNAPPHQFLLSGADVQITTTTAITTPQTTHLHTPQHLHTHTPVLPTPTLPRLTPRLPFAPILPPPILPNIQRRPRMPVLRAHLVQIKILENHQNGKDTHLRGLQVFARNDEKGGESGGAGESRKGYRVELGGMEEGTIR